jgi:16S rRNA G966 N2-methylase RsmD
MRIVAGLAKGRKLVAPAGPEVRPTADRVREAVFSALGTAVAGARALDLFAGTGALGLEALSRGAERLVLVDRSSRALAAIAREQARFELLFVDPPYASDLGHRALEAVVAAGLLTAGARVVLEHSPDSPPQAIPGLRIIAAKRYGDTSITMIEGA